MAKIKPFRGLRPTKNMVTKIVSKPYDVVNYNEAKEIADANPDSFMHVVRAETDLNGVDPYDKIVYDTAKDNLDKLVKKSFLKEDSSEHFYLYAQTMNARTQYGLVVASSVADYTNNIIKKHENTRKIKEDDRYKHVKTTRANTGPVFLTYRDVDTIDKIIKSVVQGTPEYDFEKDGIKHTFWVIDNKKVISNLEEEFAKISSLYVADGHHRSASAARVALDMARENKKHEGNEEYNYFLSVLFPASQLYVMPYNRLVNIDFSAEEFLSKLANYFEIKEVDYKEPKQKGEFLAYFDKKWYSLVLKTEYLSKLDFIDTLDVAILQNYVLDKFFGITDPRTDKRIDFVGGICGVDVLKKSVDNGDYTIAFSMFPTSVDELMKVSDMGLVMPPKSTWFEPKLLSGLIIHKI